MSIFGPSKEILDLANLIRNHIDTTDVYLQKEDVDGLCSYLNEQGCECIRGEGAKVNDISWIHPSIPLQFYFTKGDFMAVGKMECFGIHISRTGRSYAVNAKKGLSAGGYPTTKKAIQLKKAFAKYHGYLDVNKYV